tara:strand:- start:74 stop:610 length:537 start_codon:yes stop_codon:yes gene_type:complete
LAALSADRICLGRIGAPYGIKGWVKLISFTQPRDNLLEYKTFYVTCQGLEKQLDMDAGKPHGKGLVGHFVGYDTPEAARELTNIELYVQADALPDLSEDDYYWHELIGLRVENTAGQCLGKVSNLLETGANDVLVVDASADSIDDVQRLIPWLPDNVVVKVDRTAGVIVVEWGADYLL